MHSDELWQCLVRMCDVTYLHFRSEREIETEKQRERDRNRQNRIHFLHNRGAAALLHMCGMPYIHF